MSVTPRFTVITIGVADVLRAAAFYERLGFKRKMKGAPADEVAFFETGATAFSLLAWDKAAAETALPDQPRPTTYRGVTLALNCTSKSDVDHELARAAAQRTKSL